MSVAPRQVKIAQEVRWAVYRRDGYRCVQCGATEDLTLDHVHRVCEGGGDEPENLRTLCRSCNSRRTRKSGGAVVYDARRPRLPRALGELVDGKRGQVPFNRFVVEALEQALGSSGVPGVRPLPPSDPAPARASVCVRCGRETLDYESMDYSGAQPVCKVCPEAVQDRAGARAQFSPRLGGKVLTGAQLARQQALNKAKGS